MSNDITSSDDEYPRIPNFSAKKFFERTKAIFKGYQSLRFTIDSTQPVCFGTPLPFILYIHEGYARAIVKTDTREHAEDIILAFIPVKEWLV